MSAVQRVPRSWVERKPAHGSPCNRCGVCCYGSLCQLGKHVFGDQPGPCPALSHDGVATATCGLVAASPPAMSAAAKTIILAGAGCDSRINSEPINHAFNRKLERQDLKYAERIAAARKLWGVPC